MTTIRVELRRISIGWQAKSSGAEHARGVNKNDPTKVIWMDGGRLWRFSRATAISASVKRACKQFIAAKGGDLVVEVVE